MRQISKHDVNKLTAQDLKDKLPFDMISDGEPIARVLPFWDVNKLGSGNKVDTNVVQPCCDGKLDGTPDSLPKVQNDVNKLSEAKHDVNRTIPTVVQASDYVKQTKPVFSQRRRKQTDSPADGLRFSKSSQAAGRMR